MKQQKGFTIIELTIVLVVMAIISVVLVYMFEGMVETFTTSIDRSRVQQSVRQTLQHIIDDVRDASMFLTISNNQVEIQMQSGDTIKYVTVPSGTTFNVKRIVNNSGSGDLVGTHVTSLLGNPGLEFEYFDAEANPTSFSASATLLLITLTMQYADTNVAVYGTGVTFQPKILGPLQRRP